MADDLRLQEALERQRREREDPTWRETCPLCEHFSAGRDVLLAHMLARHGLRCGRSESIVDARGLVALMRTRLDSLRCICCERQFPTRPALHAHMKKKDHRRISELNRAYDQFYLAYYQQQPPSSAAAESAAAATTSDDDESDEDGGVSEEESAPTKCLLCDGVFEQPRLMARHCAEEHSFSLADAVARLDLGFYGAVQLVNWLRAVEPQQHQITVDLLAAMPAPRPWESERFLLPGGNADDPLLYSLPECGCIFKDDDDDKEEEDGGGESSRM